ncbi:hypothetical protein FKM82_001175, partial [Ascaphus truei]
MASGGWDPGKGGLKKGTTNDMSKSNVFCMNYRTELQIPELNHYALFLEEMSTYVMKQLSRAQFVSLLNDYVESEFFLIDGDSLMITCLSYESLQKGQNLHFFFLIEQFLLDLTKKGAKYVVVFFKEAEYLYFRQPQLITLRTQLILHLDEHTDIVINSDFSNFLSPPWREFLADNCPYFMLVSDEGLNLPQTCFLHLLILNALGNRINVVLTSGQESDLLRVHGYHVNCFGEHRNFMNTNYQKIKEVCMELVAFSKRSYEKTVCFLLIHLNSKDLQEEVSKTKIRLSRLLSGGSDIRQIVCIVSCSMALKSYATIVKKQKKQNKRKDTQKHHNQLEADNDYLTLDEVIDLCKIHCLSVAFLLTLPLSQRAKSRIVHATWNKQALTFIDLQKKCEFITLQQIRNIAFWEVDLTHLCDLNDDLLCKNIAYYYEREECKELQLNFGSKIQKMYIFLWNIVFQLAELDMRAQSYHLRFTSKPFLIKDSTLHENKVNLSPPGLIQMKSDLVKVYAGDILKDLPFLSSDDPRVTSLTKTNSFDERLHWHSGRPLSDDYDRTTCNFGAIKDAYALREYQKFQAFNCFYGQSLEGNISKTIVVQTEVPKTSVTTDKKKTTHVTKKETIIKENQKRLIAQIEHKEREKWGAVASIIKEDIGENISSGIKRQEQFLQTCQIDSVKFKAEMSVLRICFKMWLEHCESKPKDHRDFNIVVEMMRKIQAILRSYEEMLQPEDRKKIARCLKYVGFENLAFLLDPTQVTKAGGQKKIQYSVDIGAARFQLQYMGHYLIRKERNDPDPRVQHFIPDTWQRELLDVVDNNESAVIVAPTSSGKTYASYYCMEKILKEGNEGVVVYVAPTKALVNQVVATIYNRFNKELPKGVALCGIFTRDHRSDALNSQILVTVPQCLEILLLAPHRQKWANRIKYVIFDEVHCLGGEIGAEVWEHLLVMIRCPFLALSATISNPEHLTEWLQSVKHQWKCSDQIIKSTSCSKLTHKQGKQKAMNTENKSYHVRLVLYKERYNDLEKYVCSGNDSGINFSHYHPCAALTVDHIEKYGFPSDLAFSPRESVQLYDAMVQAWSQWPGREIFDPEEFKHFKDKIIITKNKAKKYEESIKRELISWIEHGMRKKVGKVLDCLQPAVTTDTMNSYNHFPLLVENLRKMDKLPAIFFAFNIRIVEELSTSLYDSLLKIEDQKQTDQATKEAQKLHVKAKKIEKSLAKKQPVLKSDSTTKTNIASSPVMEKPAKKLTASSKKKVNDLTTQVAKEPTEIKQPLPPNSSKHLLIDEASHEDIMQKLEKLTELPEGCTYADDKAVDNETLLKVFHRVRFLKNGPVLKSLATRGIGYHHASLDAKGKQLVEMLFRIGFIRVVTATGSLALGINMPCKSVVFMHDSVYLDALSFRQMSGRAGRRGQDLIGNVFFYKIPMPKVKKLIKSNVPQLKGQFPLGISLVLRLMLLAARSDDKEDAKAKVLSLLMHSLMSFKQPLETSMLKLYFLFSLHFLVQEGYLDQEGNPMGFTGLVTHLHYHEPSNFVFVSFLKTGLFHKLCQAKCSKPFSKYDMENLVLVLANLFGRRYLPACMLNLKGSFFQSKVFLEDLPDDFAAALRDYNQKIATIFGHCLLTISKLAHMEEEYQLPLSKISFSGEECKDSKLVKHLMNCTEGRSAISPFACLSGNTNHDLFHAADVNS